MPFSDRAEAGRLLSRRLLQIPGLRQSRPVVIAIPPGGVPVAREVARALQAPLDISIVRKLNGFGAISEDDFYWIDPGIRSIPGINVDRLEESLVREAEEIRREVELYRAGRPPIQVEDATVILVEDAITSGVAARAAAHVLHGRGANRVILAAPVCPVPAAQSLLAEKVIDKLISVDAPETLHAAEEWYAELPRIADDEIRRTLLEARGLQQASEMFRIESASGPLEGMLELPPNPKGIILFAHGSGSSRMSPRNQSVARQLNRAGFATLLFDLLTYEESEDRENVFDIGLLARRMRLAMDQVGSDPELGRLPMGLFGASTGAAAALRAAAGNPRIRAVISRGGRPDLTGPDAARVNAPVLLIVGGDDEPVVSMNREMLLELPNARLEIVPGATHLFEERGALEQVAQLATAFFERHLAAPSAAGRRAA